MNELTKISEDCRIFLGFTSNLISSGIRDIIRFLVQHKMVHVVVTTAGGVEEDFIKCLADTYVGGFNEKTGSEWREHGINRIGNLLVPNSNYCLFEDWLTPKLNEMISEREKWTPSSFIDKLGKEIQNESSVYYWCHKNEIPVFCPALTDGSIGDMIYFHTFKNDHLVLDIVRDIRKINDLGRTARKSGMIILGGGIVKHHICNANLMRNGADYAVFINTGHEYDGSDAGARPDEAISWGKLKVDSESIKIHADATLIFPLLVAATFAKKFHGGHHVPMV